MQIQKTAIVTGAAGGIGIETCKLLLKNGYKLAIIDNDEEKLKSLVEILKVESLLIVCDVSKEENVQDAIKQAISKFEKIDVLVCLAGVIRPGLFEEVPMQNIRLQMEVNFFGAVYFIHNLIPHFKKNGSGKIVVVSSLAGIVPAPKHNMYVASKFALRGLLQTLFLELKKFNIQVTNVMPDAILTPMLKYTATQDASPMAYANYPLPPEDVANAVWKGIQTGKIEIYVPYSQGILARLAQFFVGLIPIIWPTFEKKGLENKEKLKKLGILD
ncbi:MAG: SDR family oxidoreductase [Leptospiraceae bacterium]|nr:SDR family oxidoreductase [Leptospiraceae bacterium]MBP9162338.1 SDR family oxidoreductase [Leptospiraceae bacterium]